MIRSGYSDDCDDQWAMIKWRGQVASAIRGRRGQAFLLELLAALDAMPVKRLISHALQEEVPAFIPPNIARADVCAIGSVGLRRGVDLKALDPEDYDRIADVFGIAPQMVREIEFMNDDACWSNPERRWQYMRDWAAANLKNA